MRGGSSISQVVIVLQNNNHNCLIILSWHISKLPTLIGWLGWVSYCICLWTDGWQFTEGNVSVMCRPPWSAWTAAMHFGTATVNAVLSKISPQLVFSFTQQHIHANPPSPRLSCSVLNLHDNHRKSLLHYHLLFHLLILPSFNLLLFSTKSPQDIISPLGLVDSMNEI